MLRGLGQWSCRVAVVTSLLLSVFVLMLWPGSYWYADLLTDYFYRPSGDHLLQIWPIVRSERGGIAFRIGTSHVGGPPRPYPSDRRQVDPARAYPMIGPFAPGYPPGHLTLTRNVRWQFAGFHFLHLTEALGRRSYCVIRDPHAVDCATRSVGCGVRRRTSRVVQTSSAQRHPLASGSSRSVLLVRLRPSCQSTAVPRVRPSNERRMTTKPLPLTTSERDQSAEPCVLNARSISE